MISRTYVNGAIAAEEKYFLKDKLLRCCETDEAEALRFLKESGFGGAEEACEDVEALIFEEEEKISAFIREYAGNAAEREYFLAPLDCHNVKACFKAKILNASLQNALGREGTLPVQTIKDCFEKEEYSALPAYLQEAVLQAGELCEDGAAGKGAAVGTIFEKALYSRLHGVLKRAALTSRSARVLKKTLAEKADLINLTTAIRAGNEQSAKEQFVEGGYLKTEDFSFCFAESAEAAKKQAEIAAASKKGEAKRALKNVCALYLAAREEKSVAKAEKIAAETEIRCFEKRKYELSGCEPFLYYVLRKKTECENVRIVFVCLRAGVQESEIKRRLRGV